MVQEIFMTQFTTGTTCYSGARDAATLRLATETHCLTLLCNHSKVDNDPVVNWESLRDERNRDNDDMMCVGHSSSSTVDGDCQAFCFLNVHEQPQHHSQQRHHQRMPSIGSESLIASPATTQQHGTDGSAHHRRRFTHDGVTMNPSSAILQNSTEPTNLNAGSNYQRASWAHHQVNATSTIGTSNSSTVLQLILSTDSFVTSPSEVAETPEMRDDELHFQLERYTSQPLAFRPLAPCVCQLFVITNYDNNSKTDADDFEMDDDNSIRITCIWVGSADDNSLRLFLPNDGKTLEERRLNHAGFLFESPVMALDFFGQGQHNNHRHRLAVACQDGTIRLLEFQCQGTQHDWSFVNVEEYTVIVDGPIVCLHWNHHPGQQGALQVVAGSLCGYVCSLTKTKDQTWQGPNMVAQDFWDQRLQTEDSVLAVHCNGNHVALGTYSGNVCVYALQSLSGNYNLAWKCQLHYPIHALCFLTPPSSCSTATTDLVVTTRRTLHILREKQSSSPIRRTHYSAELAKQRLEQLFAERIEQSCSASSVVTFDYEELPDDEPDSWIILWKIILYKEKTRKWKLYIILLCNVMSRCLVAILA